MEADGLGKLELQGYKIIGKFKVSLDKMTTISLKEGQVKQANSMRQRHDKMVLVRDRVGTLGTASSLLFGYNKRGIKLADGDYISASELLQAIEKAIANLSQGTMIVSRKGEPFKAEDLLETVKKVAGSVIINDKLPTGNRYHWSVKGAESGPTVSKGIAMVGNKVTLGNGDYLSIDEILKALNNYVVVREKDEKTSTESLENSENEKTRTVRVVRKYKNRLSAWLATLAIILTLLSGFGKVDVATLVEIPETIKKQIVHTVSRDDLDYVLSQIDYEDLTPESAILRQVLSDLNMGDYVLVENGDVLTTRGDLTGVAKEMGKEFTREGKETGNYSITGIAIVHENKVIDYIESFNLEDTSTNLAEYVMNVCDKHGLSFEDVRINIHMGSNTERTRLGWIDVADIFDQQELTEQAMQEIIEKGTSYRGMINDFKGDTITLDNGATIKIKDDNGNLLQPGTRVIGSDGNEYIISDLSLEEKNDKYITEETSVIMQEEVISKGTKLIWRIQDCNLSLAITPLVGALASAVATRKKNSKEDKHPKFYEFENSQDYRAFRDEFIRNGEEYRKKSNFGQILKRVFYRKEIDIMQNLNAEQIRDLYHFICNLNTADYRYQSTDHITMKDGRIFAEKTDGSVIDITDIVMPYIANIGSKNKIEAEGRLEGEQYGDKQR